MPKLSLIINTDPDDDNFGRVLPVLSIDRSGWTQIDYDAQARIRYCRAYCGDAFTTDTLLAVHTPGCAYRTDAWIGRVIDALKAEGR